MFFFWYSAKETFIRLLVAGIYAIVSNHFEMLFRYVLNQTFHEFESRDGFLYVFIVFVAIVMKSNHFAIVFIDAFGSNHRSAKVTTNILGNRFGVTLTGFGVHIKTIFVFSIDTSFNRLKRRANVRLHFIEKGSTERVTKEFVVKVIDFAPCKRIAGATFRDETVYMRIPLKASSKGVKNTNKTGSKTF